MARIMTQVNNVEERHNTIISLEWLKFDTGLKEGFFTEPTLMRTKWQLSTLRTCVYQGTIATREVAGYRSTPAEAP